LGHDVVNYRVPRRRSSLLRGLARELPVILRASTSSIAATVLDGLVYQLILVWSLGTYTIAALLGAVIGGVTNFALNRVWAFPRTTRILRQQALMYSGASVVVYLCMQASLMFLIEIVQMNEHVAWFPAQLVAWVGVSYPVFRFVVFAPPRTGGTTGGAL
jgi:putative flippase GtrA